LLRTARTTGVRRNPGVAGEVHPDAPEAFCIRVTASRSVVLVGSSLRRRRLGMRVIRKTMVAAVVAMALLVVASAPASAAPVGTERLTLVTTNFTPGAASGTVVASGPVAGRGTFAQTPGDVFEIVVHLPQGSLFLLIEDTSRTVNTNERACLVTFSGGGSVLVTGGTGEFAGASGTGTHFWRGSTGFPKNTDRTCNWNAAPRAFIMTTAVLDLI
jgi:hypothetical protein